MAISPYGGLANALSGGLYQSAADQQYIDEYRRHAEKQAYLQAMDMQQARAVPAKPKEPAINPILLLTGDDE